MQRGSKKIPNPKSMIHLPKISLIEWERKKGGKEKGSACMSFEDSKENKDGSRTEKAIQQQRKKTLVNKLVSQPKKKKRRSKCRC